MEATKATKATERNQLERVRKAYGEVALREPEAQACCGTSCCDLDYGSDEIDAVPRGAFLGQGSGNPVRAARLEPGERVIDLGSGAGMDVFLAANAVGKKGRVVGFDMTPEMLARARGLVAADDYPQVEFREARIDALPFEDGGADVALSNCVINLAPDKGAVYREIFRALRPGGRFAIADIVLRGDGDLVRRNADKLPGCSCLSTASDESDYLTNVRSAGFVDVTIASERPAASDADVREMARALGLDPNRPGVSAHAVTLVGRKPA